MRNELLDIRETARKSGAPDAVRAFQRARACEEAMR